MQAEGRESVGSLSDGYFSFINRCSRVFDQVRISLVFGCQTSIFSLRYHHGSLHEAYDHLVGCRRIASPNFGFFLQLIRYEKDLNSSETNDNSQILIESLSTEPTVIKKTT